MKRWVWVVTIVFVFTGWQTLSFNEKPGLSASDSPLQRTVGAKSNEVVQPTLVRPEPLQLTIQLKKYYMDGVIETVKKEETIWLMMDFWAAYEGWSVESQDLDEIVFQKEVEDISPLTKKQGYFGLNENGELAVYNGDPQEGNVIEAFQPIPVKALESKRKIELENGIKIKDYQHFEQVLKLYSEDKEV
ncbi:BofC C-terminal domain-containing protein [Halobacillus yeomjeoni]|uniref:BofC C-terminal domain-containing protein n=1 Tax=Halobacillus yeomjeoni TaxID=311194 RepID=A0A931HV86_9BACI|nr:BofC C-terminal domain-containing protein [Halobacillus yeomjeoni]MBH0229998.1 BofC C-terminal domain-containing protein [Halobacillus yeomjeoni]